MIKITLHKMEAEWLLNAAKDHLQSLYDYIRKQDGSSSDIKETEEGIKHLETTVNKLVKELKE